MAEDLTRYLRGWIGYFGKCETPSVLQGLEKWFRRRLRSAIWTQWKRGTVRFAELRQRGVAMGRFGPPIDMKICSMKGRMGLA
jgi:RNA-directed DNA polymerase